MSDLQYTLISYNILHKITLKRILYNILYTPFIFLCRLKLFTNYYYCLYIFIILYKSSKTTLTLL